MKSVAIAVLFAFLAGSGAWAAELKAPPFWTSDQVRASRPLSPEPALVFDVKDSAETTPGAAKTTDQTVTLATSFSAVAGAGESALEDWTLCRSYSWKAEAKAMTSLSCFALPDFRILEIINRGGLNQITKSDIYWDEVELEIQQSRIDRLQKALHGQDVEYSLGDKVVVRISGKLGDLSPEEAHRLERYIALHVHLHPQARHDLEQSRVLPSKIEIQVADPPHSAPHWETLTFANLRRTPAPYPLPPGLASDIEQPMWADTPAAAKGIHEAVLAAEHMSAIPRPAFQDLVNEVISAAKAHRAMEANLLFNELGQLYLGQLKSGDGAAALAQVRAVLPTVLQDPKVKPFWTASNLAGDASMAGDREAAAKYLAGAQLDGMPFGTFRYVTFANLVRNSPDADKWDKAIFKAMPERLADDYWIHIAAFPWSANAYKDLGDTYLGDFDPGHAWLAYDLGRSADEGWRSSVMASVDDLENRLKTGLSDFF